MRKQEYGRNRFKTRALALRGRSWPVCCTAFAKAREWRPYPSSSALWIRLAQSSEFLHPRPQLDLPGPGAAGLMDEVHVALGDGVRIERAVGSVGRVGPARAPDAAVDHDVSDV